MKSWPARLGINSPFTIPSGIVTTRPEVIARIARDVPEIGFLTTKTLSVKPREGYREPIIHQYHPGCFINAVGLANPGAQEFVDEMSPLMPLHNGKPLFVSIMGSDPAEFLECASILEPVADAFELNFSCPHVKDAGQAVGSDPDAVQTTVRLLKERFHQPVIPKLSPNLGDIGKMARLCRDAGADGLSLINTVGPGVAVDPDGQPVLSHVVGGLSGAGIFPIGLRAVREACAAVDLPIIAGGGISSAREILAYREAGASFFGVGSHLGGMTTPEIASFFRGLDKCLSADATSGNNEESSKQTPSLTSYYKTEVVENTRVGPDIFQLTLARGPTCDPGRFFFLRLPGIGEKPFSPMGDQPHVYLVRVVGPFTHSLMDLQPGNALYLRGPYGKGFPTPANGRSVVLLSGGTGAAPIVFAAVRWRKFIAKSYAGFSRQMLPSFLAELNSALPGATIAIDPPGKVGEVLNLLREDMTRDRKIFSNSAIFICGPKPMMEAAVNTLQEEVPRNRILTAREDVMRCGIGLCGSCGTERGMRSCVDGPVMSWEIQ